MAKKEIKAQQENDSVAIDRHAKELFKAYPSAEEFHFTSDGTAFSSKSDAINHAGTLKDDSVQTIKRK